MNLIKLQHSIIEFPCSLERPNLTIKVWRKSVEDTGGTPAPAGADNFFHI